MTVAFEQYLNVRSAYGATYDAGGARLYFISTASGTPGLWSVRGSHAGAAPEPLAVGPERVQFASPSPRPGRLVFGLDKDGDERTQLCLLDGPGSSRRALTDAPDVIHLFGEWHADGRTISFAANERTPERFDVYVMDVLTGERRPVHQGDGFDRALGFQPGGRGLLVHRAHGPFAHELLLVDLSDRAVRSLTADGPPARYRGAQWAPNGRQIWCATDQRSDFLTLAAIDVESGVLQTFSERPLDVEDLAVSPDGRQLVYAANRDGYSEVCIRDLGDGSERQIAGPPGGLCFYDARWAPTFAWSRDSRRVAATFTSARLTQDIWEVEAGGPEFARCTTSWQADLPDQALADPELVRYPSFDGREIPAFIFRSPTTPWDGSAPALFYVHGGPENQFRPNLNQIVQYFAGRGFVVVAPNVRGSTGYGRTYSSLDDVERRLDSVRDLACGAEWIASRRWAHPRKLAVMGASYGGYMVLAALTQRPDLWAAGVDIVGIANFVTFLERTSPWRRRQREAEYGSLAADREILTRLSPIHQADRIVAPLFVVHGANDPRVPIFEAEQIVETLRRLNRPAEYLRFEDEGHGLVKLHNRLQAYPRIAEFLERHLSTRVDGEMAAHRGYARVGA